MIDQSVIIGNRVEFKVDSGLPLPSHPHRKRPYTDVITIGRRGECGSDTLHASLISELVISDIPLVLLLCDSSHLLQTIIMSGFVLILQ